MCAKKKIAVLTGAGVSVESGLSTYRDNNGLWDNYDPMEVASIEGWRRNPGKVLDFYNMQREKLRGVQPNCAHRAIAKLEEDFEVCVITQNVDNLHERAGSGNVIHLHGEVTKVRPERGVYDSVYSEKEVTDIGYGRVSLGDKAPNGSQLRPHIVFFGEAVPKIEQAVTAVNAADILLIIGTSLQVYPAAGLYHYARYDTPIFIIDPADVPVDAVEVSVDAAEVSVDAAEVSVDAAEVFAGVDVSGDAAGVSVDAAGVSAGVDVSGDVFRGALAGADGFGESASGGKSRIIHIRAGATAGMRRFVELLAK